MVTWMPAERRPVDAESIEAEIAAGVPAAEVRLRWQEDAWVVRALRPAALCTRGDGFDSRDVSQLVVEILERAGHAARR